MKTYYLFEEDGTRVGCWTESPDITSLLQNKYKLTLEQWVKRCKDWNHPKGRVEVEDE